MMIQTISLLLLFFCETLTSVYYINDPNVYFHQFSSIVIILIFSEFVNKVVLDSIIQYSTVGYSTVQYSTLVVAQNNTVQ